VKKGEGEEGKGEAGEGKRGERSVLPQLAAAGDAAGCNALIASRIKD